MQDSFDDGRINLHEVLIRDITSTFIVRVSGDSPEGAGICDGDEVRVDRSLTPRDDAVRLHPESPVHPDLEVPALAEPAFGDVARFCIHDLG